MTDARPTRVAHLDHTAAPGGAQFALTRMLAAGVEWQPLLLVPPGARTVHSARCSGACRSAWAASRSLPV